MSGGEGLRIREAVRGLVIDAADRVLLVRFEFPTGTRWALPGGGIDPGESPHDALRRELIEEIGLRDPVIGAHIWNRLHVIPFVDGSYDGQREQVYEVRVSDGFEPSPAFTWEQLNAERVFEFRWWSLDQLDASASEIVTAPATLAPHLRTFLRDGPPETPWTVDV